MKKLLKWVVSTLYGLVMIEVIVMISPFAFYWYSLYAPTLQALHRWRATAWMEAFFLPHSVITTSPFLEFLRWRVGTYAFSLGMIAFLICCLQVYTNNFFRGGVVKSWLYSRIRHPQYLSLALAGFGLLTMWPRIVILLLYLGMLFAYYFLARLEERQVEAKHPEYAEYRRRTGMFIPGNPGGRLFQWGFGWMGNTASARAIASVVIIAAVVGSALALRRYTIGHSATTLLPEDRVMAIAVWPMPPEKIQEVVSAALGNPQVRAALDQEPHAAFTAHILPADYGMVNMFADVGTDHRMFSRLRLGRFRYLLAFVFPFFAPPMRGAIMGSPQDNYQVVFSRVDSPEQSPLPILDVTGLEAKMTPVVIADVGGAQLGIRKVVIPPRRTLCALSTMPMF